MSLECVRDEFLARRAQKGDGVAFAELARRYQPLITAATRRPPDGLEREDARQAALIGLFLACRETDGLHTFAGIARLRVRWTVAAACDAARTRKQRILTDATREGHGPDGALARLSAPASSDPARVVELREHLRERWQAHKRRECDRARAPRRDRRRRYSDEQIARALAMIAGGSTVAAASRAVGATYWAARAWVTRSPEGHPAAAQMAERRARAAARSVSRRWYSDDQIARAVGMVAGGSSIRAAAAAVGASHPTVLRWLREAA